jgi:hypothetical protein
MGITSEECIIKDIKSQNDLKIHGIDNGFVLDHAYITLVFSSEFPKTQSPQYVNDVNVFYVLHKKTLGDVIGHQVSLIKKYVPSKTLDGTYDTELYISDSNHPQLIRCQWDNPTSLNNTIKTTIQNKYPEEKICCYGGESRVYINFQKLIENTIFNPYAFETGNLRYLTRKLALLRKPTLKKDLDDKTLIRSFLNKIKKTGTKPKVQGSPLLNLQKLRLKLQVSSGKMPPSNIKRN